MEKGRLLQNENINKAIQVSKITLIINLGLSLLKFAAGYIGKSSAMAVGTLYIRLLMY